MAQFSQPGGLEAGVCGTKAGPTAGRGEKAPDGLGCDSEQRLDTDRGFLIGGMTAARSGWHFLQGTFGA